MPGDSAAPAATATPMAAAIASRCPSVSGMSAHHTAVRRFSCIPSATANSQPIPGLRPWNAPNPAKVNHEVNVVSIGRGSLCVAVGVGGRVAALQLGLVWPHPVEMGEE